MMCPAACCFLFYYYFAVLWALTVNVGLLLPAGSFEASPLSGHFVFCVVADATEVRSSDFRVAAIFAPSLI